MLKKQLSLFSLMFMCFVMQAQNTTIDNQKKTESMLSTETMLSRQKVLIIPFEPKLYMSEIDKKVNAETKLKAPQILAAFRDGLDEMLFLSIKRKTSVYAFLNDSAKNAKDMEFTYSSISYSYDLVPPDNATPKDLNKPVENKPDPKIVNGQLVVEPNMEKKFMNIKIKNPKLLPYLSQKYGSNTFVFINQLDIKNNPQSYDVNTDTYMREVTVHYTIMDKNGRYLSYGVATTTFSSTENDPQKITRAYFPAIAATITNKMVTALSIENGIKQVEKPKSKPKFD